MRRAATKHAIEGGAMRKLWGLQAHWGQRGERGGGVRASHHIPPSERYWKAEVLAVLRFSPWLGSPCVLSSTCLYPVPTTRVLLDLAPHRLNFRPTSGKTLNAPLLRQVFISTQRPGLHASAVAFVKKKVFCFFPAVTELLRKLWPSAENHLLDKFYK